MGNKNVFNKDTTPLQEDPVQQALQAAAAAVEQGAVNEQVVVGVQSVTNEATVASIDSLTTTIITASDPVADARVMVRTTAEEQHEDQANVKDTTEAYKEPTPVISTIQATAKVQPRNIVQRPAGAKSRETSPTNTLGKKVQPVSADFSSLIAKEKQQGSANSIGLISYLETYVDRMAPGRITSNDVIQKQQEGLYDYMVHVIERAPTNEFKRLWSIFIAFAGAYKSGAFSPVYYSRGAKDWKRDPVQFTNLTNLLNLLQASADDMSVVNEQVNVNSVMAKGFSEEGRGRMIGFYLK